MPEKTKQEIDKAIENLRTALYANMEARHREDQAKHEKTKAYYQLTQAKEALHGLELDSITLT